MGDEDLHGFYSALGGLLKALVGILIAFLAVFLFAYLLPVVLGVVKAPVLAPLSESLTGFARVFGAVLGGLLWAIFGLIIAVFVIWALATFIPAALKAKPWKYVKVRDEALEALRLRYAKGEISREEYLEAKRTLEEG
ncbi:MAG: SHOCT domain-containing protein [Candidatus Bathyarchaeia archaeon]|nr:SHOCT domain-containing protein [Candidatus Bathyarchaeota archaeon]